MVKVERIERRPRRPIKQRPKQRIIFTEGKFDLPEGFDTMCAEEIEQMFYGGPIEPPQDEPERS